MAAEKGDYARWAEERLAADPDGSLTMWEARADYIGWCSDQRLGWHPRSKQRAAVKALGAKVKGRGDETHYLGVRLVGPMPDSGYRVPDPDEVPIDPMPALELLAEIVTDSIDLDAAAVRLSGQPGNVCVVCGRLTRHDEKHLICEPFAPVLTRAHREYRERTGR